MKNQVSVSGLTLACKMAVGGLIITSLHAPVWADEVATAAASDEIELTTVKEAIMNWPAKPKLAVQKMVDKYGMPKEISASMIVWKDVGEFKKIKVLKDETPHNFPLVHTDFVEHTLSYKIPLKKMSDLLTFDSSFIINRTSGDLSVRCDSEEHNILALNLGHELIIGKKDVKAARAALGAAARAEINGTSPITAPKLSFKPDATNAAFLDRTTLGGAPLRNSEALVESDAEILGMMLAVNQSEILCANETLKKDIGEEVLALAKKLKSQHGRLTTATTRVGLDVQIRPKHTEEVEKLLVQGNEHLVQLQPLKGHEFEIAYLKAMVKGHKAVLKLIDQKLLKEVKNAQIKKHLVKFRKYIAVHLEEAKKLLKKLQATTETPTEVPDVANDEAPVTTETPGEMSISSF